MDMPWIPNQSNLQDFYPILKTPMIILTKAFIIPISHALRCNSTLKRTPALMIRIIFLMSFSKKWALLPLKEVQTKCRSI